MVVYVWTAFLMVFYAANLPLLLVVDLDTRRDRPLRLGVGVFVPPRSLRPPPPLRKKPGSKNRMSGKTAIRVFLYLMRHGRLRGELTLSAGDAALTAIVCGVLMAVTLGRIRVVPDFAADSIRANLHGMVSFKPGHIMGAALVWAQNEISGRISAWKDMRSRAL